MDTSVLLTLSGALAMAYVAIALFFYRFYRSTADRLFAWFAVAFFLLATQRISLSLAREWGENTLWVYGLRLLAFLIMLAAILDKNRKSSL